MTRKPADLAYGLEDRPPLPVLLATALQQLTIIVIIIFPAIIVARVIQAPPEQAAALLSLTILACGVGTMLQAIRSRWIGAGYLATIAAASSHLPPSIIAAQQGGLPLVAGMTVASGLFTVLLARLLHRLRALMPPEIVGVVVMLIGLGVGLAGLRLLFGVTEASPPAAEDLLVAAATLALTGGLSVWGRGPLRWACVVVAMLAGSLVAAALGRLDGVGAALASVPLAGLPSLGHPGFAFDPALLPVFMVAAVVSALKTVGLVATLQKMNDAAWVRPEQRSLAGGVTADGVSTILAGLMGAPAVNMSPTGVAIQSATGVTSRVIALGVGGLAVLVACSPRLAALLALVPGPVIAGVLVHAGGLMMANGMQVTTSRMMDARRSQVVGLSILAALAVETLPQLAASAPALLRPVLSAAAAGTIVALLLNAVLRIGVRRQVSLTVPADAIIEAEVANFASRAGASWGARAEVVARAAELVSWCLDAIIHSGLARGPVTVKLAFDEFRLDVLISYRGAPIELAETAPTPDELLEDDGAAARLAGHMIRRRAERAAIRSRDGTTELRLALDH